MTIHDSTPISALTSRGETVPVSELISRREIPALLDVSASAVSNWITRHDDFPAPVYTPNNNQRLAKDQVWLAEEQERLTTWQAAVIAGETQHGFDAWKRELGIQRSRVRGYSAVYDRRAILDWHKRHPHQKQRAAALNRRQRAA